ncbi:ThuA domain-containing protein [Rubritalea marina]|uniref:ThuA domain-containing protein n=1 Tax=Rubritalea marina TaxID=361055 RepID=UPI0014613AF0|nr:ThuA domain-containing protein [Rubritalea marina]
MMKLHTLLFGASLWFGISATGLAQLSVQDLQKSVQKVRQQEQQLNQQRLELEKKRHKIEAQITIIQNQAAFDQAVSAMKVQKPKKKRKLLIYSRTRGFRHDSIPYGVYTLTELGKRTGAYDAVSSEDPNVFLQPDFMEYDAVLMLSTTGNDVIPKGPAREAFQKFLAQKRGLVGIHAATDCHRDWDQYLTAMGGLFDGHPWNAHDVVTFYNEEPDHPICEHIKTGDTFRDEIYQYRDDQYFSRDNLRILLSLDLSGKNMKKPGMKRKDNDYPVSWIRKYQGSRVFYSTLGHNKATFHSVMALQHFLNGIQFAMGDLAADARPSSEVGNGKPQPLPEGF